MKMVTLFRRNMRATALDTAKDRKKRKEEEEEEEADAEVSVCWGEWKDFAISRKFFYSNSEFPD